MPTPERGLLVGDKLADKSQEGVIESSQLILHESQRLCLAPPHWSWTWMPWVSMVQCLACVFQQLAAHPIPQLWDCGTTK
mmetsp:Transcript_27465/g.73924  ORF Transcript_27465/g.73924 Transcript_27465/m.73924 type:complete len:80 (-) Transcript_27465:3985-4224(-)